MVIALFLKKSLLAACSIFFFVSSDRCSCLLDITIFITTRSSRVDVEEPDSEINRIRLELFNIIRLGIQECLSIDDNEQVLAFSRIFFFTIQGIIATYAYPHEPLEVLMARLTPTFHQAVEILLLGFKEKLKQRGCNK